MIEENIENLLPQRPPFLFVDKVLNFEKDKKVECELYLNPEKEFFKGHFPNNPIMPGVLITESMAQTCGTLISLGEMADDVKEKELYYLASCNVKFMSVVKAGETLVIKAKLLKNFQGLAQFSVEALANKREAARGSIVLASSKNAK